MSDRTQKIESKHPDNTFSNIYNNIKRMLIVNNISEGENDNQNDIYKFKNRKKIEK